MFVVTAGQYGGIFARRFLVQTVIFTLRFRKSGFRADNIICDSLHQTISVTLLGHVYELRHDGANLSPHLRLDRQAIIFAI